MAINETKFTLNLTASSGEQYSGTFKMRRRLSHLQTLKRDELRRELLGAKGESAPDSMKLQAYILSTCASHVFDGPRWWNESNSGQDLLDEEPVSAVFNEISKVLQEVNQELETKAKAAQEALKAE